MADENSERIFIDTEKQARADAGLGHRLIRDHQLGRVGYGCEIDPGYAAVTLERLSMLGLKPEVVMP